MRESPGPTRLELDSTLSAAEYFDATFFAAADDDEPTTRDAVDGDADFSDAETATDVSSARDGGGFSDRDSHEPD